MGLLKRIGVHTTHRGEPIGSILAVFGYGLGAALTETHGYCTGYRMPLDLYHLRSPIENIWEKLAVKVCVVILLSERDSPKSSYLAMRLTFARVHHDSPVFTMPVCCLFPSLCTQWFVPCMCSR